MILKLKHSGMIQLVNIYSKKKEKFCSLFFKMSFLYEYVDNDLALEMAARNQLESDL